MLIIIITVNNNNDGNNHKEELFFLLCEWIFSLKFEALEIPTKRYFECVI